MVCFFSILTTLLFLLLYAQHQAAAYAQHIVDLKAMLVSEKLVAEKASMG
jgi:hypothetical protein